MVERNVLGLLEHAATLRKAGRGTRHGVLFHGPPGVGKTLVTKYLARACPDYTVILLTGRQLKLVRESPSAFCFSLFRQGKLVVVGALQQTT